MFTWLQEANEDTHTLRERSTPTSCPGSAATTGPAFAEAEHTHLSGSGPSTTYTRTFRKVDVPARTHVCVFRQYLLTIN